MLLLLGLLVVTWTLPDPPGSAQLTKDLAAVQAANVDTIALNVGKCASAKIKDYRPRTEEFGNSASAADLLKRSLDECGFVPALAQVRRRLKEADPSVADQDLDRQQSVTFAFVAIALIMGANEVFHVKPSAAAEPPVQLPGPPTRPDGR